MSTSETTIRIYFRQPDGTEVDGERDFGLENFGGSLPIMIGDTVLDPGVTAAVGSNDPQNCRVWTVVGRVFNPRVHKHIVALVVKERPGTPEDGWL